MVIHTPLDQLNLLLLEVSEEACDFQEDCLDSIGDDNGESQRTSIIYTLFFEQLLPPHSSTRKTNVLQYYEAWHTPRSAH